MILSIHGVGVVIRITEEITGDLILITDGDITHGVDMVMDITIRDTIMAVLPEPCLCVLRLVTK